jgi:hypothetical protein
MGHGHALSRAEVLATQKKSEKGGYFSLAISSAVAKKRKKGKNASKWVRKVKIL